MVVLHILEKLVFFEKITGNSIRQMETVIIFPDELNLDNYLRCNGIRIEVYLPEKHNFKGKAH